jgi:peroxiredoxin Q/BCP
MRIKMWLKVAFGAALSLVTSSVMAQAPAVELKVGDMAPAFSLPGSDGKTHSLAASAGKQAVVLAWFPKAFTGG